MMMSWLYFFPLHIRQDHVLILASRVETLDELLEFLEEIVFFFFFFFLWDV